MKVLVIIKQKSKDASKVIEWLRHYGSVVYIIKPNTNVKILNFIIGNDGKRDVILEVNNKNIKLSNIDSYWIENGIINNNFLSSLKINDNVDKSIFFFLRREWNAVIDYLFYYINGKKHLGNIRNLMPNKLVQLDKASRLGLKIPETSINQNFSFSQRKDAKSDYVTKPIQEIFDYSDTKIRYQSETVRFNPFSKSGEFFPFKVQKNIHKNVELRIFYLANDFTTCAIFSQRDKDSAIDFRRNANKLRMVPFNLPENIKRQLKALMLELEIDTGSIDMIYSSQNEFVFLEVNPVGIYDNISYHTNGFFHKKISKQLINEY